MLVLEPHSPVRLWPIPSREMSQLDATSSATASLAIVTDIMNEHGPYDALGYFIAAALLIPLGIWLKANYAADLAGWMRSFFY